MATTIREFQRQFRRIRQRAKAGEEIVVTDADGTRFTFRAERGEKSSFTERAADIAGSFDSGVGDLASNPRHLAGYGRK
ncbi:MAG: hypothetical protein ACREIA_03595 [Opitutaceae bacterium]